ncbi:hypothetical protein [Candidatus Albibeggiatoa sp. nov. NOAA]|uniref:hypothetical protein n=1 Tax=Candidatus Albibeggiatoa sp. nov. NOAA TaxID=3162724 RepID=UPI0032FDB0E4|nr:hypothetical protein [Thiotrichaceae bacterium]
MQQDFTQALTYFIELIREAVNALKSYLLNHPLEVFIIICAMVVGFILFYYLPKILAALYKDLIQLFKILMRWAVVGIIVIFSIWIVSTFPTTCGLINQHLGTNLECNKSK